MSSAPNARPSASAFADCIGCGLCLDGCPAFEQTGQEALTAKGRNRALQAGLTAEELEESLWSCTLTGFCDAVCPKGVPNVAILLELRRQLAERGRLHPSVRALQGESRDSHPSRPPEIRGCLSFPPGAPEREVLVMAGCASGLRGTAPEIHEPVLAALRRMGFEPRLLPDRWGCCGALLAEAGLPPSSQPPWQGPTVVLDPLCALSLHRRWGRNVVYFGALALPHLDREALPEHFYFHVPPRLYNDLDLSLRTLYDPVLSHPGCRSNVDLDRLARSTTAGSLQHATGFSPLSLPDLVRLRLAHVPHSHPIITGSLSDYLAFRDHAPHQTHHISHYLQL